MALLSIACPSRKFGRSFSPVVLIFVVQVLLRVAARVANALKERNPLMIRLRFPGFSLSAWEEWDQNCLVLRKAVVIESGMERIEGRALRIDSCWALIIGDSKGDQSILSIWSTEP